MAIVALDKNTAKFLTTAQVVTSVSTAVKELVENAIDAGANSIEIKLEDNGASLIEVVDNGKGIAEADAQFMALQSYTSKIKNFHDLDTLESYGFRGEALSSLCRVADVTVITRTDGDKAARLYRINHDGCVKSVEHSHRSIGTTIQARSLFQDLPVRRQMLTTGKRSGQDVKILENLLHSFAFCQPEIGISYRVNGSVVFAKPPTKTSRESLTYLFGKKFVAQIDIVEKVTPDVDVYLAIPRKDATELSDVCSNGQYVFVNQRPVSYKEIEKVVSRRLVEFFSEKIPARKKLAFLLNLTVLPSNVDVNLEPNKTSVLLTDQATIVETLDKILVKYYEIESRTEETRVEQPARGNNSTVEYHDYTSSEIKSAQSPDGPSAKKRKIEDETGKTTRGASAVKRITAFDGDEQKTPKKPRAAMKLFETPTGKFHESNKENQLENLNALKESLDSCLVQDTISQLPEVDLGEDFSAQEILDLPNLDPAQVSDVLGNSNDEKLEFSSAKSINAPVVTEEAWSKGQVPVNLHGGTDVYVYNYAAKDSITEVETKPADYNSTACPGFSKFSKEMRVQIIRENPGISYVETAKTLTSRWKGLSPEERGYYRDLAAAEKARQKSHDTSVRSTKIAKQRVSNEVAENNKKKILDMLDKMKRAAHGKKNENMLMRTVVPWSLDRDAVTNSFYRKKSNASSGKKDIVLGRLNENVWLARTGFQIWALSLDQLFDGLRLEKPEEEQITRASVEDLVAKRMRETDDLSWLHPVFELG